MERFTVSEISPPNALLELVGAENLEAAYREAVAKYGRRWIRVSGGGVAIENHPIHGSRKISNVAT